MSLPEPHWFEIVAVTVTVPGLIAVTFPLESTLRMLLSLLLQVIFASSVVPLRRIPIVSVSPTCSHTCCHPRVILGGYLPSTVTEHVSVYVLPPTDIFA